MQPHHLFRSNTIALLLLLSVVATNAQNTIFSRVSAPGEASWYGITGIAQDVKGYIWVSSFGGGLYRYDGRNYIHYRNDPKSLNSLSSNDLQSLCIDAQGLIWIGTFSKGMDCFDPENGTFTHYHHDPNNPNSVTNDSVFAIIQDHNGILWIGTHYGLNRFDPRTNSFTNYYHHADDASSISDDLVWTEYEDKAGKLWIGCGGPLTFHNPQKKGGLNCLDIKTGKFIRYLHQPNDASSIADDRVGSIFEDSKGNLWVGTCGANGLQQLNRSDGSFKKFPYDPLDPEKLSRPPITKREPDTDDIVSFITEDPLGKIWIGTLDNGITRYDPETKKAIHYDFTRDSTSLLMQGDYTSWCTFNSRDGALWIGTFRNGSRPTSSLYRVDPFKKNIPYFRLGTDANSFSEDSNGNLWLATTDNGLILNNKSGGKKGFSHIVSDPAGLSSENVNVVRSARGGRLWLGTFRGLKDLDPASGIFTRYQHNPADNNSLGNDSINAIDATDKSIVWIGTFNGLDGMHVQTKTFTHFVHKAKDSTSLSNNYVICLLKDKDADLWVGTLNGLNRLDRSANKFTHFFGKGAGDGPGILSICQDASGTIWVGTNEGFYKYDPSLTNFSKFKPLNEDRVIKNVLGITEDNEKNLWLSCPDALVKIDHQRITATFFGADFGIHHNTFLFADNLKGTDGKLYMGDQNGYYAFFPREFSINTNIPIVNITDFRLGNQSVTPGNGSVLKAPIYKASEIRLSYRQNIFSFEFIAMHYINAGATRYYYKLENYDVDWREAGVDNKAYYFSVLPGKYSFRVKAYTSSGIVGEKLITVIIYPPWWRTWWAYTIFGLLFIAALWGFISYRSKKLRRENRILEEKVTHRTEQLNQSLEDLKSTQAQLIQSEKMASLGELTAGIAHEIQNPLNFVNNFSEVNKELLSEMKDEIKKGNLTEVESIANNVIDNEEKINQHGKRADGIVKGMLQHSRTSSGQKELTDINALCDEYLRLAYHGMRAKEKSFNAKLETDFDYSIGQINVVSQEIGRVILNLINNAFYAVDEKKKRTSTSSVQNGYEPTVSVTTKKINGKVEIKVGDNGNGIPQKVLDKIFQPFFTTKPTGEGTGLGLSLAYDIVKAHGGEIKVETKEGEGAEFAIQLPSNKPS